MKNIYQYWLTFWTNAFLAFLVQMIYVIPVSIFSDEYGRYSAIAAMFISIGFAGGVLFERDDE